MLSKKYIFIAAFVLLITGCNNAPDIIVKAGSGDQVIKAAAGKNFSIQLEAQLSTGFSWKLADAPASLAIIRESVKTEEKDKAGGIDIQEFVLKSMEKGEITLTFNYAQHWKKKPEFVKTSIVKVRVE